MFNEPADLLCMQRKHATAAHSFVCSWLQFISTAYSSACYQTNVNWFINDQLKLVFLTNISRNNFSFSGPTMLCLRTLQGGSKLPASFLLPPKNQIFQAIKTSTQTAKDDCFIGLLITYATKKNDLFVCRSIPQTLTVHTSSRVSHHLRSVRAVAERHSQIITNLQKNSCNWQKCNEDGKVFFFWRCSRHLRLQTCSLNPPTPTPTLRNNYCIAFKQIDKNW